MDIASLVALGGNTLVAAAVSDGWEAARDRIARLFGRGQPDPAIERRLDATRDQLSAASPADVERVKADVGAEWAVRLKDLLADHPDAGAQLRALIEEIQVLLPAGSVSASGHAVAGRDINVSADRGSVAAGVIHGSVAPPGPTRPGPASG
ncbi:MAG TPA: hypothetical protein VF933_18830 [Streptosporangiaceae bacterium]